MKESELFRCLVTHWLVMMPVSLQKFRNGRSIGISVCEDAEEAENSTVALTTVGWLSGGTEHPFWHLLCSLSVR